MKKRQEGLQSHIPVLLSTILSCLLWKPEGIYVDGTCGQGGHSEAILKRLRGKGHLIAIDWDQKAIDHVEERFKGYPNITIIRDNFANLPRVIERLGIERVDGILLDLGLSSAQLSDEERGFSFGLEAPLDMRMDERRRKKASDLINNASKEELVEMLRSYGQERYATSIARAIIRERQKEPITTTSQLKALVARVIGSKGRKYKIHPSTRTFMAIRIAVNEELDNLRAFLEAGPFLLSSEGRLCILSYHSLEDRIVKRSFQLLARGCRCPRDLPECICGGKPLLKVLTPKPITPSPEEVRVNPRSRSAKLRVAQRV